MSEVARITAHYFEQVAKHAKLRGFDEVRAELESAAAADDQHFLALDAELTKLREQINVLKRRRSVRCL